MSENEEKRELQETLAALTAKAEQGHREAQAAMEGWTTQEWDGYRYYSLPAISLSPQESDATTSIISDLDTLIDNTFLSWVVGVNPLNDDTWDAFVAAVESMGVETVRENYQSAYERYLTK